MPACSKIPYPNLAAAKFAAAQIAADYRRRGITRVPRGVHPCAACHCWHVTSHRTKAEFRVAA